jgi:hypothetical protein
MAERLYTIDDDTEFFVQLTEIKNIEDAGDVFYTEDELKETLGLSHVSTHSPIVKTSKITEALNHLKQEIIKRGKKTIIIDDLALLEFFQKNDTYSVSYFVKGLRRVGNRLFLHEKNPELKVNKKTYQHFIARGTQIISHLIATFTVEFKYVNDQEQRISAVELIKKLLTWEQFSQESHIENNYKREFFYNDELKLFKDIWDNPSIVPAKNA